MFRYAIFYETAEIIGPYGTPVPLAEGRRNSGRWAPLKGYAPCKDRAGRKRRQHTFDGDGTCIFCNSKRRMEEW